MRILYSFLILLTVSSVHAQTAEVLFVNTNTGAKAELVDIEFMNQTEDSVYASIENVPSPGASVAVEVPANEIISVRIKDESGNVIYNTSNSVYTANQRRVFFYSGTQSSTRVSQFTGYTSTSSGKVKIDFRNSTNGLPDIDAIMRTSGTEIADDISYGDGTFTFSNVFAAEDDTLDLFQDGLSDEGLFAYDFPASQYDGEYIVLFTYGSSFDNDVYVLQMDGELTKLNRVGAFISESGVGFDELYSSKGAFDVYPNPSTSAVKIESKINSLQLEGVKVYSAVGDIVIDQASLNAKGQLNVSNLESGVYQMVIFTQDKSYSTPFAIQ